MPFIDFVFLPLYFRFMSEQITWDQLPALKQLPRTLMKNSIVWMSEAEGFWLGAVLGFGMDEFFLWGGGKENQTKQCKNPGSLQSIA